MWCTSPVFLWGAAVILFLVIEVITMGLTTIWFAAGALAAFVVALAAGPVWLQMLLFLAVSLILVFLLRPMFSDRLNRSRVRTNVNSMVGKEARVTKPIANFEGTGQIVVGGMEWSARSQEDGQKIPAGAKVEIREIRGVKAIVAPRQ